MSSLLVFNRVYILEIQSFILVLSTGLVNFCPSNLVVVPGVKKGTESRIRNTDAECAFFAVLKLKLKNLFWCCVYFFAVVKLILKYLFLLQLSTLNDFFRFSGDSVEPEALNKKALDIVHRVRDKLTGRDFNKEVSSQL